MNFMKIVLFVSVFFISSFAKALDCTDSSVYNDQVKGIACANQFIKKINKEVTKDVKIKRGKKTDFFPKCDCDCYFKNGLTVESDYFQAGFLCDKRRDFLAVIFNLSSKSQDGPKSNADFIKPSIGFVTDYFKNKNKKQKGN